MEGNGKKWRGRGRRKEVDEGRIVRELASKEGKGKEKRDATERREAREMTEGKGGDGRESRGREGKAIKERE